MIHPKVPLVTGFTSPDGAYLLGNLAAISDWGHARDYIEMQWLIHQQEQPEDYVIASGKQHKVRSFVDLAASELGIHLTWCGQSVGEQGYDAPGCPPGGGALTLLPSYRSRKNDQPCLCLLLA